MVGVFVADRGEGSDLDIHVLQRLQRARTGMPLADASIGEGQAVVSACFPVRHPAKGV